MGLSHYGLRTAGRRPTASAYALYAMGIGGIAGGRIGAGCGLWRRCRFAPTGVPSSSLTGVDPSLALLRAFRERAERTGKHVTTIEGAWPDMADQTPVADVVVCHHVAYNVPDLAPFVRHLTDHARRVVMELTARHPMSTLNDLWLHFHGLIRPTTPIADDAVAVLRKIGALPQAARWEVPAQGWSDPSAYGDLVAWIRRRLCLPPERDAEIGAALGPHIVNHDGSVSLPARGEPPIDTRPTAPNAGRSLLRWFTISDEQHRLIPSPLPPAPCL